MRNALRIMTAALALGLLSSAIAWADTQSGTVVAVDEEVVKLQGDDGNTYEVKAADVVAEDLKTGDLVEYELVEGQPVKAKKKMK